MSAPWQKYLSTQQLITKCDNVTPELKQQGYLCRGLAQSIQHKECTRQKEIYFYHILLS